jgi:flavin reductase (DIM6/NTAB) family NADH-FMN oxidoreductase RutF
VCALLDGVPTGLAANSFTSVSLDPPLVSVCVQNSSSTWPRLRARPRLGVSVLAEGQDQACALLSMKHGDRFAGLSWNATEDGAVFIDDAAAWLGCSLYTEVAAGDHSIVLLQLHVLRADPETAPLVFHGGKFRQLASDLSQPIQ